MDRSDLIEGAEYLISIYRDILNIDPFYKLSVEVVEGDYVSVCIKDELAASWLLKLNPQRHNDAVDIQYSVIEALLRILFKDIESSEKIDELISRLMVSFVNLLPIEEEEEEEDEV